MGVSGLSLELIPYSRETFRVWYGLVSLGRCSIETVEKTNKACGHYSLLERFWGRGFGQRLQDEIEVVIDCLGYELEISPRLSYKAWRMWEKRDPSRLEGFKFNFDGVFATSLVVFNRLYGLASTYQ